MSEILVKEYRGDIVENVHYGSIAIVAATGETVAYIGDIEKRTYMRSASKPIQVLPTIIAGLHEKYNLTPEEIAMFNSSHWGSNHHIFVLEDIIKKTGLSADDMVMNETISTSATVLAGKLTEGSKLNPVSGKSRLQHCCSGKHLSLMLLQRELTGSVKGYHFPDSPVQKKIISFISMLSQTPLFKINIGIDGCGVPVFALPMRNIALSYAKMASPFNLPEDISTAIAYNFDCINKHPEKINDYFTPSYYVNKNPDLLMKDGSRGVICMSIKSRKLGIVIKLEDGWSDEFQGLIIARVLEQLKYDDQELIDQLKKAYKTKLFNDCGTEVGHVEVDFDLNIDDSYFESLTNAPLDDEELSEDISDLIDDEDFAANPEMSELIQEDLEDSYEEADENEYEESDESEYLEDDQDLDFKPKNVNLKDIFAKNSFIKEKLFSKERKSSIDDEDDSQLEDEEFYEDEDLYEEASPESTPSTDPTVVEEITGAKEETEKSVTLSSDESDNAETIVKTAADKKSSEENEIKNSMLTSMFPDDGEEQDKTILANEADAENYETGKAKKNWNTILGKTIVLGTQNGGSNTFIQNPMASKTKKMEEGYEAPKSFPSESVKNASKTSIKNVIKEATIVSTEPVSYDIKEPEDVDESLPAAEEKDTIVIDQNSALKVFTGEEDNKNADISDEPVSDEPISDEPISDEIPLKFDSTESALLKTDVDRTTETAPTEAAEQDATEAALFETDSTKATETAPTEAAEKDSVKAATIKTSTIVMESPEEN